jgi:hypothetical protein
MELGIRFVQLDPDGRRSYVAGSTIPAFGSIHLPLLRSSEYKFFIRFHTSTAPTELGTRFVLLDPDCCRSYGAGSTIPAFGSIHLSLLRSRCTRNRQVGIRAILFQSRSTSNARPSIQGDSEMPYSFRIRCGNRQQSRLLKTAGPVLSNSGSKSVLPAIQFIQTNILPAPLQTALVFLCLRH